jgi:hypothetical protein
VKLAGRNGSLILERSDVGPPGTPGDRDLLLNITVDARGFAAADQSWIVDAAWEGFIGQLRTVEARRQGRAILDSASPGDLHLEIFSTDSAGHMAVQGQVRWRTPENFELLLRFGFAFEPDELPRVLAELEGLGHW